MLVLETQLGENAMKNQKSRTYQQSIKKWLFSLLTVIILSLFLSTALVRAEDRLQDIQKKVQIIKSEAGRGGDKIYLLSDLKKGEILYVYMESLSGNLDPFIGLSDTRYKEEMLATSFYKDIAQVISSGGDPLVEVPKIYDNYLVAWDDDSGAGYDAAFEFLVPEDGDYQLLAIDAPANQAKVTGDYNLIVGINAPEVLTGTAKSTGDEIAVSDTSLAKEGVYVQEITGTISAENPKDGVLFMPLRAGDTIYAYVEATSGGLAPVLLLEDFGGKPLRAANISGTEKEGSLKYTLDSSAENYRLQISSKNTTGDYRLMVGVNDSQIFTGEAEITQAKIIQEPIDVQIGVELQQITGIDQISENFGAVASVQMAWQDPKLAFSPDDCQCRFETYTGDAFSKYVDEQGIEWPQFTIFNQQGNRWAQNSYVVVLPDGSARYYERFTTVLQAPLFDFTRFPFDTQHLYVKVNSLYKENFFTYTVSEKFSGVGEQLGEEEWFITDSYAEAGVEDETVTYSLNFDMQRHLIFYIFRIFVPIILISLVSWFVFFLKDYGKRVDVASANLLVFVAFNFTVSGELPRLGYLTFMDMVLIGAFVISALTVIFNVYLKRLELRDKGELAEKIDKYSIWVYPLLYVAGGVVSVALFLV